MDRYSNYFLQHLIWLQDDFCKYYVQDPSWCSHDVFDAPCVIFDEYHDAEQWLQECFEYESYYTMQQLRGYLCEEAMRRHLVGGRIRIQHVGGFIRGGW